MSTQQDSKHSNCPWIRRVHTARFVINNKETKTYIRDCFMGMTKPDCIGHNQSNEFCNYWFCKHNTTHTQKNVPVSKWPEKPYRFLNSFKIFVLRTLKSSFLRSRWCELTWDIYSCPLSFFFFFYCIQDNCSVHTLRRKSDPRKKFTKKLNLRRFPWFGLKKKSTFTLLTETFPWFFCLYLDYHFFKAKFYVSISS